MFFEVATDKFPSNVGCPVYPFKGILILDCPEQIQTSPNNILSKLIFDSLLFS